MWTFFDDENLSDSERLHLHNILYQATTHDPKCFFLDDANSIAALQRYEKLHGPLPETSYSPAPIIPCWKAPAFQHVADHVYPTTAVLPAPLAAAPFGATFAPCFPAPQGFLSHHPPTAHPGAYVYAQTAPGAPATAVPSYFYPAMYLQQPVNAAELIAYQQAVRSMFDQRMAATAAHFAALQSAMVASTAPAAHADITHLIKSSESSIDGTCTSSVGGGASVATVAETAAARDVVPIDPEPAEQQQHHLQLVDNATVAPVIEQRPMTPPIEIRSDQNDVLVCKNVHQVQELALEVVSTPLCSEESTLVNEKTEEIGQIDDEIASLTIDTTNACANKISPLISIDTVESQDDNAAIVPIKSNQTTVVQQQVTAPSASPAAAANKSWASLFKNSAAATNAIVISKLTDDEDAMEMNRAIERSLIDAPKVNGAENVSPRSPAFEKVTVTTVDRDPPAQRLGKTLISYKLEHKGPGFQLRGLKNFGNWCYIHAVLQALLACPPFVHLLRGLKNLELRTPSSTPMLDALVKFVGEFSGDKYARKSDDKFFSFEPTYVYNVLSSLRDDASFSGRQEDAEEFLGLVLNHLHEETAASIAYTSDNSAVQNGDIRASAFHHSNNTLATNNEDNEWRQVVPGRRLMNTRTSKLAHSPISEIFSGVLRNAFQQNNAKETVSLESFFTLQLSVQSNEITSLQSALFQMLKEVIPNKDPVKKTVGDITRRTTFQELPIVLVLHLKYFVYADDAVKKQLKPITYGMDLHIDRQMIVPQHASSSIKMSRSYKLFAVVFHHGEHAEGGHYTADIFHGGQWVNMDDGKFESVPESHVLDYTSPRVPYLLFYRRCDVFCDNRGMTAMSGFQHQAMHQQQSYTVTNRN